MEKINIAELLKGCPKDMELDCTMFEDVYFDCVDEINIIHCYIQHETYKTSLTFNQYGAFNSDIKSKCVIFPKGKTTWEEFIPPCKFKEGDIVSTRNGIWIGIVKKLVDCAYETYITISGESLMYNNPIFCFERFATEEEKQKLFDAIKAKGYKWNPETKTLEKLIESNEDVDDKIVMSGIYFDRENYADEVELHLGNYEIEIRDSKTYAVFKKSKNKTLKKLPKFKVGDKIRHKTNNKDEIYEISKVCDDYYEIVDFTWILYMQYQDYWELVPNKFDINTLKPFKSKVLIRGGEDCFWKPAIFGFYNKINFYVLGGNAWEQCIPFKNNEHLLGTTDDCDEFYKTWE